MNGKEPILEYAPIRPCHDAAMARIVRAALKEHGLDVPGTAYFDPSLDSLSAYYDAPGRAYEVLLQNGAVIGGVGVAAFDGFENCCELQKLYLDASARGRGLGYDMIRHIEDRARAMGYRRIYLETHSALQAAIHEYERSGYARIDRPPAVVHTAMDRFYSKDL